MKLYLTLPSIYFSYLKILWVFQIFRLSEHLEIYFSEHLERLRSTFNNAGDELTKQVLSGLIADFIFLFLVLLQYFICMSNLHYL